jgi:mRNA interferase MazF
VALREPGRIERTLSILGVWKSHNPRVVVVPLTSNMGRQYPGEALVTLAGKPGKAMADQVMAADKSRLKNPMGSVSKADMTAVETAILIHLGMPR